MSSSSAVPVMDESPVQLNVGELVEQAIKQKLLGEGAQIEIFNSSTDNFLFLLEKSGARDIDGFSGLGSPHVGVVEKRGYSSISNYDLEPLGGKLELSHRETLAKLRAPMTCHATIRELLSVFDARKKELIILLKKKRRIVALGKDVINPYNAACLSIERNRLILQKVPINSETFWKPTDIFVLRTSRPC